MRGYGGPVLNPVYPVVIVVVAPFVARWALFDLDVSGLVSRLVGLVLIEPLVTTLLVVQRRPFPSGFYAASSNPYDTVTDALTLTGPASNSVSGGAASSVSATSSAPYRVVP